MNRFRIRLVKGWKTIWKQWSTWLIGLGSTLIFFAPEFAGVLTDVWMNLPMDVRSTFDPTHVRYFGYFISIISIPAKAIRQKRIYNKVFSEEERNREEREFEERKEQRKQKRENRRESRRKSDPSL